MGRGGTMFGAAFWSAKNSLRIMFLNPIISKNHENSVINVRPRPRIESLLPLSGASIDRHLFLYPDTGIMVNELFLKINKWSSEFSRDNYAISFARSFIWEQVWNGQRGVAEPQAPPLANYWPYEFIALCDSEFYYWDYHLMPARAAVYYT
jgi:hypothetical protein